MKQNTEIDVLEHAAKGPNEIVGASEQVRKDVTTRVAMLTSRDHMSDDSATFRSRGPLRSSHWE